MLGRGAGSQGGKLAEAAGEGGEAEGARGLAARGDLSTYGYCPLHDHVCWRRGGGDDLGLLVVDEVEEVGEAVVVDVVGAGGVVVA